MITAMEYDLLRCVDEAGDVPATNKFVGESYYRLSDLTASQTVIINSKLKALEEAGLVGSRKENTGNRGGRVSIWTMTDAGAEALREYKNGKNGMKTDPPGQPEFPDKCQPETGPGTSSSGDAPAPDPLPAAAEALHPETIAYLESVKDELRDAIAAIDRRRYGYALDRIKSAAKALDAEALIGLIGSMRPSKDMAAALIVASDLIGRSAE